MKIFDGLNKNILILTIVLIALIAALNIMLKFDENPESLSPVIKGNSLAAINKNIADLSGFDADLDLLEKEGAVLQELDSTLNEVGEITEAVSDFTEDENNLNNLDDNLAGLTGDENVNNEIDKSLEEVSL